MAMEPHMQPILHLLSAAIQFSILLGPNGQLPTI